MRIRFSYRLLMSLICSLLFSAPAALLIAVAQNTKPIEELRMGGRSTHALSRNETHSYRVPMKSDQYFSLRVEQLGVDVVVDVFGPDGKLVEEFDSPNGDRGPEVVSLVATSTGDYRIDVRPLEARGSAGNYQIELDEIRASDALDKQHVAARRHSNELAARLHEAVEKQDDQELPNRFDEALRELAHPGSEPILLAFRISEAIQLPVQFMMRGDIRRAGSLAPKLLEIAEKELGPTHALVAAGLALSLQIAVDMNDSQQTTVLLKKAAPFLDEKTSEVPAFITLTTIRGIFELQQGNISEAEQSLQQVLMVLQQSFGIENHPGAVAQIYLGNAYTADHKYSQAEASLQKAISTEEKLAPQGFYHAFALASLGGTYVQEQRYADAVAQLLRARTIAETAPFRSPALEAEISAILATAYLFQDRYADAESLFRRTIQMIEDTFGPDHPKLVPYIELWVPGLRHLGKTGDADELEALADKIRSAQKH